mmetsp:Transcript_72487/g.147049  ORF Transcript_72487/g.147049 Transcript_72487/m.147049 type:complete len:530 (-) Transcript_72487:1357-2946(-)
MAYAHDQLVGLLHVVDEVLGRHAAIMRLGEHLGSVIEGAAEARADGEEATAQSRDQVLARTGGHDGVVGAAHRGPVVRRHLEDHLDELATLGGQLPAEPKEGEHTAHAEAFLEDLRDGDATILELLTPVIGDGGDKVGRLPDDAKLLRPSVVHGHRGRLPLRALGDLPLLDHLRVSLLEQVRHLIERIWHKHAGLLHSFILGCRRLRVATGLRPSMSELDLRGEARRARPDAPSDDWLVDAAGLHCFHDIVLIDATNLAKEQKDLAARVILVAQEVINESAARIAVAANCDAFVDAVGVPADDVVQLVRHAAGLGHIGHRAWAVEPGHDDVVQHAARVPDADAARLDTAHRGRADHANLLHLSHLDERARLLLWHTLSDDRDGLDLRILHRFHCGLMHRPEGREVDERHDVRMPLASFLCRGVDGHQNFLCAPVKLHVVVPGEGEDHGRHGRLLPPAHMVEVQHALNSSVLHAVDNGLRLGGGGDDGVPLALGRWLLGLHRLLVRHLDESPVRRRCGAQAEVWRWQCRL